ncbi:diguanylate cyclase [Actinoplanes rectilineatus]|uniref:diguanylate cyclase n=1 Tax=Actinoplanes rectilineatus TaxID=113571 RepID=UPI0005F2993B|nr:diguanylate cyclase [Actinoplanes rectilineatus]
MEVLYDSDRTHVVRLQQPDGSWVVCKRPLGPRAADRLRNEVAVLRRLHGVPGTPQLAAGEQTETLTLRDFPASPLAGLPLPWDTGELIGFGQALAEVLAGVHRLGVVHRDVSPANILVGPDRRPTLIDFELAVLPSQEREALDTDEGLAGTLPYLAPEQTGRTGRPVDHRADLYSLGAILYELATGAPPFGRDRDTLSLIHDHLARMPDAPADVTPGLPVGLSEIVMRLLHKEPDRRYQSAEGLAYDLRVLGERRDAGRPDGFRLGARDFPIRIAPPSRLIGREAPLATLHELLEQAVSGHSLLTLITGPPGVGKTALVERLRPAVTAAGGRFVSGKFDQFQQGRGGDALREAFDRLGTLLLAEPDDVVAGLRERLREVPDHRVLCRAMPAFQAFFGERYDEVVKNSPEADFAKARRAALGLLRTVAGPASPLVLFIDDLQWAPPGTYRFLDDVLGRDDLPGVLLLGAYRPDGVDETHPLSAIRDRLRREGQREILLDNLGADQLTTLVAEMLRLPADRAALLAGLLAERTGGNPFDTAELLNALRREGVLVPDGAGWAWSDDAVRQFVGHGDVVDLLGARIEALPPATRDLVELMACLGPETGVDLLGTASALTRAEIDTVLRPAVDDGLVAVHEDTARFRHDRVQQAAFERISTATRAALSLTLARRLAAVPGCEAAAAPHYLAGVGALLVPGKARTGEKQAAADLLRRAAAAARRVANHAGAEAHLAAAARLLAQTDAGYADAHAEWHAALCALGRFDDADRLFAAMLAGDPDPVWLAGPAAEQVGALTHRRMLGEALGLGLDVLRRLGVEVPAPQDRERATAAGLTVFFRWLATAGDPATLPALTDPRLLAAARLTDLLATVGYLTDKDVHAWMIARMAQVWASAGIDEALAGPVSHLSSVMITKGDYRSAGTAVRHLLAVADTYGWEAGAARVKYMHAVVTAPWCEPLTRSVRVAHEARDGLLRAGDLRNALYTYYASVLQLLGCADLDTLGQEMNAAAAFADRIGAGHETSTFADVNRMIRAMLGTGGFDDLDEDAYLAGMAGADMAAAIYLTLRSLTAAVLGDDATLDRHSARAVRLLPAIPGSYVTAIAHVVAILGAQVRGSVTDLDRSRDFLAARAADQPANFRHLQRFAEATRAAMLGDFGQAAAAYDEAMADAETAGPSWHRPLIVERAALFYLGHGLDQVGAHLLGEALRAYTTWGATAKVRALRRAHPSLSRLPATTATTSLGTGHSVSLSSADIDLIGVVEAARALSSATSLDSLRVSVQQVLSRLTGATAVHLILWDTQGWTLPPDGTRPELPVAEAAHQGLLPLTAIRYAERTREPLLVDDVALDDRVGRDPYLKGLEHCSLLAVPVLNHGEPRAMLLLENRLSRRAFSTGRLDAVRLIAGQLTVSLENARLYASLEQKVAERTEALNEANHRLELMTVTDPLTGLPNRRRLTTFLAEEWLRAQRSGAPIGVAMIDIDNFKKYNDHYGHQGGDDCLRLVAETLRASVRVTDLAARYGGEEFCLVMPGAGPANALLVATRACEAVAALHEPHAATDAGIVTISVGVTTGSPQSLASPEQLTKLADEALYEAKQAGRNRVVSR